MSPKAATNPFTPASDAVNVSSPSESERPVILPHIPELYNPLEQTLDGLLPRIPPPATASAPEQQQTTDPAGSALMAALRTVANRTKTTNNALAYNSTLSPTLDAFASLSQATDHKHIDKLLTDSWATDPAVTLRIIWNLRSIHEGKSAREQFYRAYGWLYIHHPRTAIANLRHLVDPTIKHIIRPKASQAVDDEEVWVTVDDEKTEYAKPQQEVEVRLPHGYWKDLLNILLLATLDQLHPKSRLSALHVRMPKTYKQGLGETGVARDPQQAKVRRLDQHRKWHDGVVQKLAQDKKYRALYVTVACLFAAGLARDIKILQEIADANTPPERRTELSFDLTLVGKWAPTVGGSHDRVTSITTPIAELLYKGGFLNIPAIPLAQPLTQETAHRLRSAYTRWVTSPLRRILQVPEVAMSAGRWDKVEYTRVPSHSMRANKSHFIKHDNSRFSAYLRAVAEGKASVSGATLLPHELLMEAMASSSKRGSEAETQVIEAQWNALVERVRESGTLSNALSVCDVSGSMGYLGGRVTRGRAQPIAPAVALSIVLAQVARPPWANAFITFSANPELVTLDPDAGLVKMARNMVATEWGANTDFQAVFTRLILPTAIEHKLPPEEMIQRLFVFSDMQFDQSRSQSSRWASEHQHIKMQFEAAGYTMPEIVYWNLAGSVAKPVTKDEKGVALVSGFSPGMLKVFLDKGELDDDEMVVVDKDGQDAVQAGEKKQLDPMETMLKALGKESFAALEILD